MSALAIVLIVLAVLILLLFTGGYVANARRRTAERAALHARVQEADRHLAAAHAEDKGWERSSLEAAARAAFAERHGVQPRELNLIQVVDRPGTDEDEAVFSGDGHELVLGRRGGSWVAK
jgi:Tfp pilus assembly protein PilE